MNKIVFIIPYFGKFNNYFQLFLNSCEKNADTCDWIIFTDDRTSYSYPKNVKVNYIEWKELCDLFKKRLDPGIILNRPYKLCDYKPAYGYIFEEFIDQYDYWGHCDVDVIWGNIGSFLSEELLSSYDKIFDLGHCTLYRNKKNINRMFKEKVNNNERWKEVYFDGRSFSFDEEYENSINNIFINNNFKVFDGTFSANLYTKTSDFKLTFLTNQKYYLTERKMQNVFIHQDGHLYRLWNDKDEELKRKEYMYIHFQSRKMNVKTDNLYDYIIIPNAFENLNISIDDIDQNTFSRLKKKNVNLHYFRLRINNLKIKVKRMLGIDI